MVYAEIGEDNVCFSILSTPETIDKPTMIVVDDYDTKYLGATYDTETKNWTFPEPIPEPEPELPPTEEDMLNAELLLNQMQIIETQAAQDLVLAEILLNQN